MRSCVDKQRIQRANTNAISDKIRRNVNANDIITLNMQRTAIAELELPQDSNN